MNVSIVVATFGSPEWHAIGNDAFEAVGQLNHDRCDVEVVRVHEPDGTLAEARNRGAREASLEWLCFLDADDRLEPGYLDAMADAHARYMRSGPRERHEVAATGEVFEVPSLRPPALLVPAIRRMMPLGSRTRPPEIPAWGASLIDLNCAVIGTLVNRRLFLQAGGFTEWPSLEDWELWLRLVGHAGCVMVAVPGAVYQATVRPDGRNSNQGPYTTIRFQHSTVRDWSDVSAYKEGPY